MRLYRTWSNGVRLIVQARSLSEARQRFAAIRRDYRAALGRGNPAGSKALNGRVVRVSHTLKQANARDRWRQPKRRAA